MEKKQVTEFQIILDRKVEQIYQTGRAAAENLIPKY